MTNKVDLKGPWKTKAAALIYLQVTGWAIEKQTFYNATNPKHPDFKFNKEKDGFTKKRVDKYAKEFLVRADSGLMVGEENGQLQRDKIEKENKKLDIDIATKEFNFDLLKGNYLPRNQLYPEIIGRAGVLDSGYNFMLQSKALEIVALVGGDQKKVPEFLAFMKKEWNTMLGIYARLDNIDVVFTDD
jgi:hypothetical protein